MSQSELERLVRDLERDQDLKTRILADSDLDGAAARARDAGYDVSDEDLNAPKGSEPNRDLSLEELSQVAGGQQQTSLHDAFWNLIDSQTQTPQQVKDSIINDYKDAGSGLDDVFNPGAMLRPGKS